MTAIPNIKTARKALKNGHHDDRRSVKQKLDSLMREINLPVTGKAGKTKDAVERIVIAAPNFQTIKVGILGESPYVQHAFSQKTQEMMEARMEAGSTAKKGRIRPARDFKEDFKNAQHISRQGWNGIPAPAFRSACIDVCRMVGFQMTRAKMSIFIIADGNDKSDGQPLVKIEGKPVMFKAGVRLADGSPDVRSRPIWHEWRATLTVRYDGDQFTAQDIVNLIDRAGQQVGVGEGRAFSKKSHGQGWGHFRVEVKPTK